MAVTTALLQEAPPQPPLTTDVLVVFGVVALALVLFVTERLPIDVTAILLMVLLIPLSYASQLGGMLTLIGTSTNILASDVSARLGGQYPELHAFSMFEFTKLGALVVLVGGAYPVFVGHRLLPERVPPRADYLEEYEVGDYLADLRIPERSPLAGETVADATGRLGPDVDVVQVVRDGDVTATPRQSERLASGDVVVVSLRA